MPARLSPQLPEGSWWDHQLIGCTVSTEGERTLGTVTEIIHTGANDVWVAVDEADAETLVPALKEVLVSVDVVAKRIVVREVPGLTVPEG